MDATQVCCVRACPAKHEAGLSYYSLPVDIERRVKWLQAIGRPDIKPDGPEPNNYFVCSKHFENTQMGVLKQVLPDTIPTRNIPRIRKGLTIITSTTASQTDFSSSDDDDDDDFTDDDDSDDETAPVITNKRTIDEVRTSENEILPYFITSCVKRRKPNRKVLQYTEIERDIDIEIRPNDAFAVPLQMFVESCNFPRDSIYSGKRKIFTFYEDENSVRNNSEFNFEMPKNTLENTFEAPKEFPANSNLPITTTASNTSKVTNTDHLKGNDDCVNVTEPVISNVVTLSNIVDNKTLNKFIEWKDRMNSRNRGPKFEKDFKMLALNLHTLNTRAYKILINAWKLPKESELKNIQLNIGTKFDEQMTRLLSQKFASLSREAKYCTLGVYAKPLKRHFYYDPANDEIIGMHNVNGITDKMAADCALVATVRGIQVAWHQPVAFALISTVEYVDSLNVFIKSVCLSMKEMGLRIAGIVLPDDQTMWKFCRTKHFISTSKYYLSTQNDRMSLILDIPHILNRLKNDFIKNDLIFENKTVSWKYVRQAYDLDKERGGRLLSKLTDEHLKRNSREKSLKIPCEVFSKAVSTAIHFYVEKGLMPKEAAPTADFIKKFNDAFDVLNRKTLNKLSNARSAEAQPLFHVRVNCKAIDDAHAIFKKLKTANGKELDTLKYFLISLKSLISITGNLKFWGQKGIAQTRFCSLEPMLDFLKEIEDDAKSKRPSPIQFTRAFSKLFLIHLIDLTPSPKSIGSMDAFLKTADDMNDCSDSYNGQRIYLKDTDYRFSLPEQYSIIYVASYLVYKCFKRHKCEKFENHMKAQVDMNKTKIYCHFEGYNKDAAFYAELKLPAFAFVSYIERLDDQFIKDFDKFYHVYPAVSIYNSLKSVPKSDLPCECFPIDYMLKLFVRTRIYQTMIHNTSRCKDKLVSDPSYELEVKKL